MTLLFASTTPDRGCATLHSMRRPLSQAEPTVLDQFVDAVHALSAAPDASNVKRYLAASRALEASRPSAKAPAKHAA
jgi:hypothetical protein